MELAELAIEEILPIVVESLTSII